MKNIFERFSDILKLSLCFNITLQVHRIVPASSLTMPYADVKFAQHIVIRKSVHQIKCTTSNFVLDLGSRWTKTWAKNGRCLESGQSKLRKSKSNKTGLSIITLRKRQNRLKTQMANMLKLSLTMTKIPRSSSQKQPLNINPHWFS